MTVMLIHHMAPIMFASLVTSVSGHPAALRAERAHLRLIASSAPTRCTSCKRCPANDGIMNNDVLLVDTVSCFMVVLQRLQWRRDPSDTVGQLFGMIRAGLPTPLILRCAAAATTGVTQFFGDRWDSFRCRSRRAPAIIDAGR